MRDLPQSATVQRKTTALRGFGDPNNGVRPRRKISLLSCRSEMPPVSGATLWPIRVFKNLSISSGVTGLLFDINLDRGESSYIHPVDQSLLSIMGNQDHSPSTMYLTPDDQPHKGKEQINSKPATCISDQPACIIPLVTPDDFDVHLTKNHKK